MALTRTQKLEVRALILQKLSGKIKQEPDTEIHAWIDDALIKPMSDEQQEALYDDLLAQVVDAQTEQRDTASTHFSDVLTVLDEKKR